MDFFEHVLENAPARVAVVDRSGKFIYINHVEHTAKDRVKNMTIFDFVPVTHQHISRDNLDKVFDEGVEVEFEAPGVAAGKFLWFNNKMSPYRENDIVKYAIIYFEDITAAKEKEQQERNKQAQLSAIINNTNDVILSVDKEFRIIEFNEELANKVELGFGRKLEPGISVFEIILFPEKEKLIEIYNRVLGGERITQVDRFYGAGKQTVFFETAYNPISTSEGINGIAIFSRNITNEKADEEKLRATLKEKETLLAEIHHRVKNNLASISSIIQLQAINTDNPEILELLSSAQSRIKTTALVHEMLYENDSLSHIAFHMYIRRLCIHLRESYSDPGKSIHLEIQSVDTTLNIRQAIPCGLLLNELVTNTYKHAFHNKEKGAIFVTLENDGTRIRLTVADDGLVLKDEFDPYAFSSTGMILIQTLTQQLEGSLRFKSKPLTEFSIEFEREEIA